MLLDGIFACSCSYPKNTVLGRASILVTIRNVIMFWSEPDFCPNWGDTSVHASDFDITYVRFGSHTQDFQKHEKIQTWPAGQWEKTEMEINTKEADPSKRKHIFSEAFQFSCFRFFVRNCFLRQEGRKQFLQSGNG